MNAKQTLASLKGPKIQVALHSNGSESKVYLLKLWKRSSSGFLWKAVFEGPLERSQRVAKGLADFLRSPLLDAEQISNSSKPEVAHIAEAE